MRDPQEIIQSTAELIDHIKSLLHSTNDRLRLSRLQLEQSRKLLERVADLEGSVKRRQPSDSE